MPDQDFSPNEVTVSKMRPYSLGIVAQNKPLNTNFIDVTPIEDLNMLDGEITGNTRELKQIGSNADGSAFNTSVLTKTSIKAEWIPIGQPNRLTSPDVRRGAVVQIYQFGDSAENYFWTTLKQDLNIRKLETVIYAFSATQKEDDDLKHETSYYFEISTHKKLVTFHTSKANGEPTSYDIQIDSGTGKLIVQDDMGNEFLMNSTAGELKMKNSSGSFISVSKSHIESSSKTHTINAPGGITLGGPITGKCGAGGATFDSKITSTEMKTGNAEMGNVTATNFTKADGSVID